LSLSNFFDSENIGLRHSLSLSKKFDRDNEHLNPILQHIFYTVLMSNFLARWQDGKKNISAVTLYLFYIRKVFLGGTPKSSTAFFTVHAHPKQKDVT
jgi:hypothetical protein